ncbi:MAG: pyridoxal phosphate-dependent aminotransferase family protein [Candidatus Heimdallarchaeota archaeon]|nr:pyridoxal phosphate-dependent aminotransferase family protein [Candidatus Heimdallarchaeota archaeon]
MTQFYKKCDKYLRMGEATLLKKTGLYPYFHQITGEQNPVVQMDDNKVIMLGSNNYLGMTSHPKVKEAAQQAIEEFGVGTTGSRLLNGTMNIHVELEERLAKFFGTEDCLVFSTGMQANLGAISAMLSEKDEWVLSDQQNHASIIDGIKLGRMDRSNKKIYNHNDMEDLERCLQEIPKDKGLIVTDGVFSMEGDIVKLDELADLAEDYGAGIYIDDAHAVGVIGPYGRGTAAHFDLVDKVGITMGTFSKSFATIGGYIAGSKAVCNWLKHKARSFIFSASPPPANCATVLAILDIIEKDETLRKNVLSVAHKMREELIDIGYNVGDSSSAIIPLIVGERRRTMKFFKELFNHKPIGIFSNPVVYPATPKGRALMRTSYIATMTDETVNDAIHIFEDVGKKMKIL